MATILYLVPGVGMSEKEKHRREKLANDFLTNKTNRVIVEDIDEGPKSIESTVEEALTAKGVLKKLAQVQDQYDAVILGCAGDASLIPAREFSKIPIIGPLEASLHVASMLGDNFSIITVLDSLIPSFWRILRMYGMHDKCVSVRSIEIPVLEINKKKEEVTKRFAKEAKNAVKLDGASTIIPGCMSLAFLPIDELIGKEVNVPVVNPAKVSVKVAEMLVSLKLSQSPISFPKPDYEKLDIIFNSWGRS